MRAWGRPRSEERAPERSSGANRALHVALVVASFFVGALVEELFAFAEGKRDLGLSALEVELERYQRQTLTLDRADHLPDLLPVQQEFPRPRRLVIEVARLFVGRYVQVEQKYFSISDDRVGISDVGFPVAKRFDLTARQNHSCFPGIEDVVVVPGAFVPRHRLLLILLDGLCHLTSFPS